MFCIVDICGTAGHGTSHRVALTSSLFKTSFCVRCVEILKRGAARTNFAPLLL